MLKTRILAVLLAFFSCLSLAQAHPLHDYTRTRYPIVLVHGMLGFDKLFHGFSYWYNIAHSLERGGAEVYVLSLSPLNSTEVRGEQAIEQLETLAAISGAPKFNIIGHSQGGLDGRYVAATRPDLVASLTTVATPHHGAALADYLLYGPHTMSDRVFMDALSALGPLLSRLSDGPLANSLQASLRTLSTPGAKAFNARYPAGLPGQDCAVGASSTDGHVYFSWGGVGVQTSPLDPLDPAWLKTSSYYEDPSDGLVSRCSSHFGTVLRDDYMMNHLDSVNQMLGLVSHVGASPEEVYRVHANRLKGLGL